MDRRFFSNRILKRVYKGQDRLVFLSDGFGWFFVWIGCQIYISQLNPARAVSLDFAS